jgi:hypothetical protein
MTTWLMRHHRSLAVPGTVWICLWLICSPASAQVTPGFEVTIDPVTSCAAGTPVTGTISLVGLTPGYGVDVQLRGGGGILDRQAFEGHHGYPDGVYTWSVAGTDAATHEVLELSFALFDGKGDLVRDEIVALNPECAPLPASPAASPAAATSPGTRSRAALPAPDAGSDRETDVVLVAGFAGVTVLLLAALSALDRRPQP